MWKCPAPGTWPHASKGRIEENRTIDTPAPFEV
jgi:hypothetical protein